MESSPAPVVAGGWLVGDSSPRTHASGVQAPRAVGCNVLVAAPISCAGSCTNAETRRDAERGGMTLLS